MYIRKILYLKLSTTQAQSYRGRGYRGAEYISPGPRLFESRVPHPRITSLKPMNL
jgi:hypothetical protein